MNTEGTDRSLPIEIPITCVCAVERRASWRIVRGERLVLFQQAASSFPGLKSTLQLGARYFQLET